MSAVGQKRRFDPLPATSGLLRTTDIIRPAWLVPLTEVAPGEWQIRERRRFSRRLPNANLPQLTCGMRWGCAGRSRIWTGNRGALAAVIAVLSLLSADPAAAEKRIALVVGNSAYQNITRLDNPRNDATLMADTLRASALP